MKAWIDGKFSNDLAIDLGTANTLVYAKGRGVVSDEASVVAVRHTEDGSKKILAVGREAKKMLGKTPGSIMAVRPLQGGVIADFDVTEAMLRHFIIKSRRKRSFGRPRVVIGVPYGVTEVEKRAVRESAESAGAGAVYLIQEPMAAAIGAGLAVSEAKGSIIVDVGGGTTEVALISLSHIVFSQSIRVGGDKMDSEIISLVKKQFGVLIGQKTAEEVKIAIGEAVPGDERRVMKVKGRDLIAGVPKTIELTSDEVRMAIADTIATVVETVRGTLEKTPPELAADIMDRGMMLTGGGSLIKGLDVLLSESTGLAVSKAPDPLMSVVQGGGMILEKGGSLSQYVLH